MGDNIKKMKTLKLDSSYRPIEIIDALEALVMCFVGKAYAIETYAKEIKSVSAAFKLPAVIILNRIVKFRYNGLVPNRLNLLWRDGNQCQYCAENFSSSDLTLDHIIPKSRGGRNTWENLVVACKKCNQKKGAKIPQEADMHPIRQPVKPRLSVLRTVSNNEISELWRNYLWEKA
jgi:5-methylcytosine-specific restriction endonuclease McrA